MKAILLPTRIRVKPVPTVNGFQLWVWLKKPLTKEGKGVVFADITPGQKFYDLPCERDNIVGVVIK